jgi:hypothetical protein
MRLNRATVRRSFPLYPYELTSAASVGHEGVIRGLAHRCKQDRYSITIGACKQGRRPNEAGVSLVLRLTMANFVGIAKSGSAFTSGHNP